MFNEAIAASVVPLLAPISCANTAAATTPTVDVSSYEGNIIVIQDIGVVTAGTIVGEVTSGGFGPTVNHPVAMGLVAVDAAGPFFVELRGRRTALAETRLPFVPHQYRN
jgi:glycine cleavage system aminomethyltransferase T